MRTTETILLTLMLTTGCDEEPGAPPPISTGPSSTTLPIEPSTTDASTTGEDVCPWDGACASLVELEICDGWALACGDGWRCVNTMTEAGIVCAPPGVSSGTTSSGSTTTDASTSEESTSSSPGSTSSDTDSDAATDTDATSTG